MTHRIRYTKGPDELSLGDLALKRGEWSEADEATARQAMLPDRVKEYGFECDPALAVVEPVAAKGGNKAKE